MMKAMFLLLTSSLLFGCGASGTDDPREETVGAEIASGYNQQMQRAQDVQLELETGSLVELDVAHFPLRRSWYLVRRSDKPMSPVAQRFASFVLDREHD